MFWIKKYFLQNLDKSSFFIWFLIFLFVLHDLGFTKQLFACLNLNFGKFFLKSKIQQMSWNFANIFFKF